VVARLRPARPALKHPVRYAVGFLSPTLVTLPGMVAVNPGANASVGRIAEWVAYSAISFALVFLSIPSCYAVMHHFWPPTDTIGRGATMLASIMFPVIANFLMLNIAAFVVLELLT
jgi:hypothetical protein